MPSDNYKGILIVAISILKEQAHEYAGTVEGLGAWQVLKAIKEEAETWDVPLSEIGLEGYDPDELLNKKS